MTSPFSAISKIITQLILVHRVRTTYVNVGRSLYWALNWINWVKNGSVSLVVPIATALPAVPMTAIIRRTKSSIESPLLTGFVGGVEYCMEVSPATSVSSFIFPGRGLFSFSFSFSVKALVLWDDAMCRKYCARSSEVRERHANLYYNWWHVSHEFGFSEIAHQLETIKVDRLAKLKVYWQLPKKKKKLKVELVVLLLKAGQMSLFNRWVYHKYDIFRLRMELNWEYSDQPYLLNLLNSSIVYIIYTYIGHVPTPMKLACDEK